jgi:hypothetical protein
LAAYFGGIFWRHILAGIFWQVNFGGNILVATFWREYIFGPFLWWGGDIFWKNDLMWMSLIFAFSLAKEITSKLFTKDSTKTYNQTWQRRTKALHV